MADLKSLARQIFEQTLRSIDIPGVMERKLGVSGDFLQINEASICLRDFETVIVIAAGKAAHQMLEGLARVLPSKINFQGIVSAPTAPAKPLGKIKYFAGGHPTPDQESWNAAEAVVRMLADCDSKTLVFFLLSGGGSALVELPLDRGITLRDVQQTHRALVTCGAPIEAVNTVRKHFSAVKGGRLASVAALATKITIGVSDVPAGKEWALASGPTLPDPSSCDDVRRVLEEYALHDKLPAAIRAWLAENKMPETPKPGDPAFAHSHFVLLLGLDDLFHPAHCAAEARGCITFCDNSTDDWPIERAADFLLGQLRELLKTNHDKRRVALIAGGEVSSRVTGNGVGGRNSAFVLACAKKIAGQGITVLSAGTDGIDGNSPAAGAVADGETCARAAALGLNIDQYFENSDAYSFFKRLGDDITTGPTGNNLRDLRIFIAETSG